MLHTGPIRRWLVWTAVVGVVLMAAAQAWPERGTFTDDVRYATVSGGLGEFAVRTGGQGLAVSLLGSVFGLMAAIVTSLVLAATLLLMHATAPRSGCGPRLRC